MTDTAHRDDEIPGNRVRKVVKNFRILGGTPVFSGTRIPVYEVVAYAEDGMDAALKAWPYLSKEDVETAIKYVRAQQCMGEANEASN